MGLHTQGGHRRKEQEGMGCSPAPPCFPEVRSTAGIMHGITEWVGRDLKKATHSDPLPQQGHQPDQWPFFPLSGTAGVQRELLSRG